MMMQGGPDEGLALIDSHKTQPGIAPKLIQQLLLSSITSKGLNALLTQ